MIRYVKKPRPTILVLGGRFFSSAAESVHDEGANVINADPYSYRSALPTIENDRWDGIVLCGGGDIDPRCYGEEPREETRGVSESRDIVEHYALEEARDRGVPVLGICRGMQMIAVESGGKLCQNIEGHRGGHHPVDTVDGSVVRQWAGEQPSVVSLHHQAVIETPRRFVVTSTAEDGTVESIESEDHRVLGVQFHPEMDDSQVYAQKIFRWLVVESASNAGLTTPRRRRRQREPFSWRQPYPVRTTIDTCPLCYKSFSGDDSLLLLEVHIDVAHGGRY